MNSEQGFYVFLSTKQASPGEPVQYLNLSAYAAGEKNLKTFHYKYTFHLKYDEPLVGKWEVAMTQYRAPKKWFKMSGDITLSVKFMEATKDCGTGIATEPSGPIFNEEDLQLYMLYLSIVSGYNMDFNPCAKSVYPQIEYDEKKNQYYYNQESEVEIIKGAQVYRALGFDVENGSKFKKQPDGKAMYGALGRTPVENNIVYLRCDFIEDQIIGGMKAPILRILPTNRNYIDYKHPYYVPLSRGYINKITFELWNEYGRVGFESGNIEFTLHFRPVKT